MTIFGPHTYHGREVTPEDITCYQQAVTVAVNACTSPLEREQLLRNEAIAITQEIIDGIRDVLTKDRHIRNLVLNQGLIPIATWTDHLRALSTKSLPHLKATIDDMRREMEQGQIGGFPGTMFLYNKPTFITLDPFYQIVFELAGINRP